MYNNNNNYNNNDKHDEIAHVSACVLSTIMHINPTAQNKSHEERARVLQQERPSLSLRCECLSHIIMQFKFMHIKDYVHSSATNPRGVGGWVR